jgi:diguanylate cyclase (GGDEF)-like protein/PAS domain S-box-containing protein
MGSRPQTNTLGGADEPRFARKFILDPINLTLVPNLVLLAVAHHFHAIAPEPLWAVLGSLSLAHISAVAFTTCFPMGTSRARPKLFLAVAIGLCGVWLYLTGWGAIFSVALVAAAAVVIHTEGSRYGRTAILMVVVTIAAGEVGVALGIFKSMIPDATAHAVAAIEATITVLVIMLVTRGQRDTELAQTRERESEERFRALVQYTSDAIFVVADGGRVMYASPAVEHVLGCAPDELESFDISWIDPDHADSVVEAWLRLRARPGSVESLEVPIRRVDGTSRWVEVRLTNLTDSPAVGGFVCNMRDIGERRDAQAQLMHDAQHDPLTRLPNRRHFLERLDDVWRATTPDDQIAVLFIDVDNFKEINDQYGHNTGDSALVVVANTLSKLVRPSDVVARYGGDEFTVLLDGLPCADGAFEIAERITRELSREKRINNHDISISVSIGVSTSVGRTKSVNDLVRDADQAMYRAKRNGRARWESYEPPGAAARSGPAAWAESPR